MHTPRPDSTASEPSGATPKQPAGATGASDATGRPPTNVYVSVGDLATGEFAADATSPSFGPTTLPPGVPGFPFLSRPQAAGEIGRLGDYRVLAKLGEGGMGFVFRGEEVALQRLVALKVMRPEVAAKPNAADRFLREGRAAAGLKSDHIITVYGVGTANGVPYLAMEFLEGAPLDAWLGAQKKAVPLPHALRVVRDTLRGLAAAHEKGLIHRDIKPANLWIEKGTSRIKILDFGLTRGNSGDDQLTQEGAVVGTPAYMAPEQAGGKPVDPRADLFSVGVVFYHLLAGKNPFARGNLMETLGAIGFETQPPVTTARPDVPKAYADFLDRLLAKNPDHRPANAKAALQELIAIEKGQADVAKTLAGSQPVVALPAAEAAPQVWGALTADEGVQVHTTRVEPSKPAGPRKPPNKKVLLGGGLFAAALVLGGIIIVITNKDGTKTKVEVPDGATVDVQKDGKTVASVGGKKAEAPKTGTPTGVVMDANRKAAEFALGRGGLVITADERNRVIKEVKDLPAGPFELTTITVGAGAFGDAELDVFKSLRSVEWFDIQNTTVSDAGLAKLAGFPFASTLRTLYVGGPDNESLTDEAFRAVAKFPALTTLSLTSKKITGSGIAHLAGTNISGLGLPDCPRVADAELVHLKGLPNLGGVSFVFTSVGDAGLAHVAAVKRLDNLKIQGCEKVTDAGLKHLEGLENLRTLQFGSNATTPAALRSVAKIKGLVHIQGRFGRPLADDDLKPLVDATALKEFAILSDQSAVTDAGLETLARIKTLKELNLKGSKATINGVKKFKAALPECKVESDFDAALDPDRAFAEWATGRGFNVSIGSKWYAKPADLPKEPFKVEGLDSTATEADLDQLSRLTDLKFLGPGGTVTLSDAGLKKLATFPFAKNFHAMNIGGDGLTDAGLAALAGFPELVRVTINGKNLTGTGFASLKGTKLGTLSLCQTKLNDSGVKAIKDACPDIGHLDVQGSELTDEGMKTIAEMKLTYLRLINCNGFTDAGVKRLEKCEKLEFLDFESSADGLTTAVFKSFAKIKSLKTLYYSGNNPTFDLSPLAGLENLEALTLLMNVGGDDSQLEQIAKIKSLKELRVYGKSLTAAGVKKFKAARPECKVESAFDEKK